MGADSGGDALADWQIPAHLLVGDLDSIHPEALAFHRANGCRICRYPTDKDQTDLELALGLLPPAEEIHLSGIWGGRFDHTLMNLHTVARFVRRGLVTFDTPEGWGGVMGPGALTLTVPVGAPTALLALSPRVSVRRSSGVRWPLREEILRFGESRGISNQAVAPTWELETGSGRLMWLITGPARAGAGIGWHPRSLRARKKSPAGRGKADSGAE